MCHVLPFLVGKEYLVPLLETGYTLIEVTRWDKILLAGSLHLHPQLLPVW